jgi:hypothetical protein
LSTLTIARAGNQMSLLSVQPVYKVEKNAQSRNAYGNAAQEIVCACLGLSPIAINGNYDICFDAEKDGCFYEIKSAYQRSGRLIIYDWRLQKEGNSGVKLFYAVLCHNAKGCKNGAGLYRELQDFGLSILLIPIAVIAREAQRYPLRTYTPSNRNIRYGYGREGYKAGYRLVPLTVFDHYLQSIEHHLFSLYGVDFTIPVRICL